MSYDTNSNQKTIEVRLFGTLRFTDGEHTVDEQMIRSDAPLRLLAYILYHSDRICTAEELSEALWPGGTSSNPAGALKNLAYRLRMILRKSWPDEDLIITVKGGYRWNPEIVPELDTDMFKDAAEKSLLADTTEERIRFLETAVDVYNSRFLENMLDQWWILSEGEELRRIYRECAEELVSLLEKSGKYKDLERVAERALYFDPFNEGLHTALLRTYIGEGYFQKAEEHYLRAERLFYDNLGLPLSDEMRNLFEKILEREHEQQMDLESICCELREAEEPKGAYLCEYGVFKKIYELESRRVPRAGSSIFLSLLTMRIENKAAEDHSDIINGDGYSPENEELLQELAQSLEGDAEGEFAEQAMTALQEVIMDSLRTGDVLTRYSPSQYLIMLPACPYENAKNVMERIIGKYKKTMRNAGPALQYSLKEMGSRLTAGYGDPLNFASTLRILIDRADTDDISGRICGAAMKETRTFEGTVRLMSVIDTELNEIGRPQPDRLTREFVIGGRLDRQLVDNPYVHYQSEPRIYFKPDELRQMKGKLLSCSAEFRSRSHGSVQGLLYIEENDGLPFESEVELIRFLRRAVNEKTAGQK